ncbi:MAG: hypothetical protein IJG07_05515 [Prevotella sp.]|nr:hypothetical protein [Prevotella sp.]
MAGNCTTDKDLYANIGFCVGQASLPGIRPHFYVIRRADIVSFPKVGEATAENADMESVVTIKDNFALVADAVWKKIELIEGESEPSCDGQGAEGSKSFLNHLNLVLPGTQKKVTGFIKMLNNDDVIIAYPQRDGAIRIIGNEMFRVQFELGQNAGKAVTDMAQTTVNASVSDVNPAPFYEGVIKTSDGDIDGKTDTLKTT